MGERLKSRRYGEVRRSALGNYIVYHRPQPDGVEILRVVHSARDQQHHI
jgi:plasmid stabilization system protein ParE